MLDVCRNWLAWRHPYWEMHCINSDKPETKNHSSVTVEKKCCRSWEQCLHNTKNDHSLPFTLLTGTWVNGCWIWGHWKHSWHTVMWLYDPFDSWSPQIPGDLEATTSASASSGRRRSKLQLSESHLDRCSVRWSLSSEPAPTLTATDWESHRARWVIRHRSWLIWL